MQNLGGKQSVLWAIGKQRIHGTLYSKKKKEKKKKDFKARNELQKEIQQLELSTNDAINIQTPKSH